MLEHPGLGKVRAWNDVTFDKASGVATYETHYQVLSSGRRFSAASKIAFPTRDHLAAMLEDAGLAVEEWLGDWVGNRFGQGSPEIIPMGRLR